MTSRLEQSAATRHKRQYNEAFDRQLDSSPSKRPTTGTKLHSTAFYESLPRVWLTQRALKEFNRQTQRNINVGASQEAIRSNLSRARFARAGGPDLSDLRGHPNPSPRTMSPNRNLSLKRQQSKTRKSSKSTAPTSTSSRSRRSSAYDKNFEEHLQSHHIYLRTRNPKPDGLDDIAKQLSQPRKSLSPSRFSDSAFEKFQEANDDAVDEGDIMRDVIPILNGGSNIHSKQNLLFTRFEPLTDGTIVDAKPDLYDGARLETVDKRVREDIGNYIIPTHHTGAPVVPNFFLEVKRPSGGADVAKRQACYNGALGVRAMHKLQSYGKSEPTLDGRGYVLTSTYHDGQLKMYASHARYEGVDGESSSTAYHMTPLKAWALTSDPDSFRQGATWYRNGRDWAQIKRDDAIAAANKVPVTTKPELDVNASQVERQEEDIEVDSHHHMSQHFDQDSDNRPVPLGAGDPDMDSSSFRSSSRTCNFSMLIEPSLLESETSSDEPACDTASMNRNKRQGSSEGGKAAVVANDLA